MKIYHVGDREIPADTLEKIAADVRTFDASQSPEASQARSLDKIARELPRLRDAVSRLPGGTSLEVEFRITAMAVQTALSVGVDPLLLHDLPKVQRMLAWLGVE